MKKLGSVSIVAALALTACGSPQSGGGEAPQPAPAAASEPATAPQSASESADGWTTLFDGSNLDHWQQVGDANWQVVDNTVRADSGNGFLVSKDSYDNFDLRLEFWVDVPANSGVFLRCSDPAQPGADSCYEVNIFDTRPDQTYRTGAIVNVAQPEAVINTGGRWNDYQITADGSHLTVHLNGTLTVDTQDDTHGSGPIGLQYGSGFVIFRNVQIRPH